MRQKWTSEESAYLRDHWLTTRSAADIAVALNRSARGVRHRAKRIGLSCRPPGFPPASGVSKPKPKWRPPPVPSDRVEMLMQIATRPTQPRPDILCRLHLVDLRRHHPHGHGELAVPAEAPIPQAWLNGLRRASVSYVSSPAAMCAEG